MRYPLKWASSTTRACSVTFSGLWAAPLPPWPFAWPAKGVLLALVGKWTPLVPSLLTFSLQFHSIRQLLEVLLVNDYQGTMPRANLWALRCGASLGDVPLAKLQWIATEQSSLYQEHCGLGWLCVRSSMKAIPGLTGTTNPFELWKKPRAQGSKWSLRGPLRAIRCPHSIFEVLTNIVSTPQRRWKYLCLIDCPLARCHILTRKGPTQLHPGAKDGSWDSVGTLPDEKWKMILFVC